MSDESDPDPGKFAVYIIAAPNDVDSDELLRALDTDSSAEPSPFLIASDESFSGLGTQRIIAHHRDVEVPKNRTHRTLLLIADQSLVKGILMVNLNPYHGYVDAIRQDAHLAGNSLCSMSIANTDWYTERENLEEEQRAANMMPEDRFALYNTLLSDQSASFGLALKWMNDSVGELGVEDDDDEENRRSLPIGLSRSFYRSVSVDTGASVDAIMAGHAARSRDLGLDPDVFAVVDFEWENKGIIIALVPRSSFRCKIPVAGDILTWTFVGLMTWEEAEAQFAS